MKLKQSLLVAAIALTGAATQAQEQAKLKISGEFRPRSEFFGRGQSSTAAEGSEGFVRTSVRAALKAKYTTENVTVFTSFQEVFSFGDRQQITPTNNGNFRVQEAWADIKLGEATSLKIGRQPLSYDDQRILGGLGWAQQARTHDAAVLKYSKDGLSLDLGAALNTNSGIVYTNTTLFSYRDMGFLRLNKKFGALNLTGLALVNTYQNGATVSATGSDKATLFTGGLHADYKEGAFSASANAFLQEGNRMVGSYQDVSGAYLASIDLGYKLDGAALGLGFETISGSTDDSAAFFPLYGTNHKFNGLMDRFYVGNHANAGGLNDLNAKVSTKIAGAAVTLKGHYFTEVEDANGDDDKNLGSELDLIIAKQFKGYKVVGGYSQFFETSEVIDAGASDFQNWAWLMLIVNF